MPQKQIINLSRQKDAFVAIATQRFLYDEPASNSNIQQGIVIKLWIKAWKFKKVIL